MSKSIPFEHPTDSALEVLKSKCSDFGISIENERQLSNGMGTKIIGVKGGFPIAMVLYFNSKAGTSTKLVIEKMPEDVLAEFLIEKPLTRETTKGIPIHASIIIARKLDRDAIKSAITEAYSDFQDCTKTEHMAYLIKIDSNSHKLTITQFSSGTLLIQGIYSTLVDRIVSLIEVVKPLTAEERALFFLPEGESIIRKEIEKRDIESDFAHYSTETKKDEYLDFLFPNDRMDYYTGELLREILNASDKSLPQYNFLIAIYSRILEGFIIKLMVEKDFFTLIQLKEKPDKADIGNALRNRKFEKYIRDKRRDGYIIEDMIARWEGNRCKEMHSDPNAEQGIISVSTIVEAEERIGGIMSCIRDAYNILVKYGLTDSDLQNSSQTTAIVPPLPPNKHLISKSIETKSYIGTDESGKGDYLGPLVIAGVYVDNQLEKILRTEGVKDSKLLSDKQIKEYARMIKELLNPEQYSIVQIFPEKYNELYSEIKNLNTLLAWGHARALENVLANVICNAAIADQFGNESSILKALMDKGKRIELTQLHKGEQYIGVAAASILARDGFLNGLYTLGKRFNITLPKGASEEVVKVAREFVKENGNDMLNQVAKIHFKTTRKVLS